MAEQRTWMQLGRIGFAMQFWWIKRRYGARLRGVGSV